MTTETPRPVRLEVMLVEDEPADMRAYVRDLPRAFEAEGCAGILHQFESFDDALTAAKDPSRRFDVILSDTYKGRHEQRDAAVMKTVKLLRGERFCPLVVFSSGERPEGFVEGPFAVWADKSAPQSIEQAIGRVLRTGIPQAARRLHEELDRAGADYIWKFLEKNWEALESQGLAQAGALNRLVRARAAVQLKGQWHEAGEREIHGLEYYVYPPLSETLSLGEIVRRKTDPSDVRVVVTPHCYLTVQANHKVPRAEYVRVVRSVPADSVLGERKNSVKASSEEKRAKYLRSVTTPPSKGEVLRAPDGRFWFLPAFLEIGNSYCDFLQVESLPYPQLKADFESLAVLASPYAESLQACLTAFDGAVGIPTVSPDSSGSLLL